MAAGPAATGGGGPSRRTDRLLVATGMLLLAHLAHAQQASCPGEALLQDPAAAQTAAGPGFAYGLSVTPSEAFDSSRTRVFPFACGIQPQSNITITPGQGGYPGAYNAVMRRPGELFLLAGTTDGDAPLDGSYIVKFNTNGPGLEEEWRTQLVNTTATNVWNYPGVVAVDSQERVLAVFGSTLAVLDPETGEVAKSVDLPVLGGAELRDTAFNGFNLLSDGSIITKCVSRSPGCEVQGFSAFLQCPLWEGNGTMVLLDGDSLEVLQVLELPGAMGGRVTSGIYKGTEYIFLSGNGEVYRWSYSPADKQVTFDEEWQGRYDANPLSGPSSALALINGWLVTMTNAVQSVVPMIMSAINIDQPERTLSVTPFKGSLAELNSSLPESVKNKTIISWAASAIAADPELGLVFPFDFVVGRLAAYKLTDTGFEKQWEVGQRTSNFLQLVGPPSARQLVGTHVPELSGLPQPPALTQYATELLQFRDAATGELLAESAPLDCPAIGLPSTPGYGGQYFFYGNQNGGNVFRLSFETAAAGSQAATSGGPAAGAAPSPAPAPPASGAASPSRLVARSLAGLVAAVLLLL